MKIDRIFFVLVELYWINLSGWTIDSSLFLYTVCEYALICGSWNLFVVKIVRLDKELWSRLLRLFFFFVLLFFYSFFSLGYEFFFVFFFSYVSCHLLNYLNFHTITFFNLQMQCVFYKWKYCALLANLKEMRCIFGVTCNCTKKLIQSSMYPWFGLFFLLNLYARVVYGFLDVDYLFRLQICVCFFFLQFRCNKSFNMVFFSTLSLLISA